MPTQASGPGGEWHSSARAAVTSHHKLDDLANRYSLAVLESGRLKFKVLSKTMLSPRFWVEAFLVSSLFLGVAADPGCPLACRNQGSASVVAWPPRVSVFMSSSSS